MAVLVELLWHLLACAIACKYIPTVVSWVARPPAPCPTCSEETAPLSPPMPALPLARDWGYRPNTMSAMYYDD